MKRIKQADLRAYVKGYGHGYLMGDETHGRWLSNSYSMLRLSHSPDILDVLGSFNIDTGKDAVVEVDGSSLRITGAEAPSTAILSSMPPPESMVALERAAVTHSEKTYPIVIRGQDQGSLYEVDVAVLRLRGGGPTAVVNLGWFDFIERAYANQAADHACGWFANPVLEDIQRKPLGYGRCANADDPKAGATMIYGWLMPIMWR